MSKQANIEDRQVEVKGNCLVITIPQADLINSVEHFGQFNEPNLFRVTDHNACLNYFQKQLQQPDLFVDDPIDQVIDEMATMAARDNRNRRAWIKDPGHNHQGVPPMVNRAIDQQRLI